jgi:hypothetical protein
VARVKIRRLRPKEAEASTDQGAVKTAVTVAKSKPDPKKG